MSDLLNAASLVMIPSGYSEDKVYSAVPTDGSGDLSFTRASNGTRVNSAGLVEDCPWNLVDNSENLTLWGSFAVSGTITRTANYATAPNGTMTATRIQNSGGSGVQWTYKDINLINGGTISMYVKRNGSTNQTFRLFGNNGAENSANFTATSEWQRFEFVILPSNSAKPQGITTDSSGNAADILVWGAQVNIGSTANPYFPTTDRLNVPRLTYQNGGGGCPSLLLEKQSTNQYTYSEDLTQWLTSGSPTITGNDAISPDGTTNADRVQFNASGNLVYNSGTGSAGTNVLTVYAKAKSGTAQKFRFFANGATLISSDFTATDQWQRFEFSYTYSAQTAGLQGASTGASDVLFWGFQHEVSSYPTSYIPTTSASATRVADACFKTGISSLIGQSEGVLFTDFVCNGFEDYGTPLSVNNGSTTQYIWITTFANKDIRVEVYDGAVQASVTYTGGVVGQRYKVAFAYKTNDFAMYVNGSLVGTDFAGNTFSGTTLSRVDFNITNSALYANAVLQVNQAVLFKTRLTNAELASLTTL
jgi:hypothetical protein